MGRILIVLLAVSFFAFGAQSQTYNGSILLDKVQSSNASKKSEQNKPSQKKGLKEKGSSQKGKR